MKNAVPPPLLKVVLVAGVPQTGNVTIAIETRRRLERVHRVYSNTRKPYSGYPTQLISQGVKEKFSSSADQRGEGMSRRLGLARPREGRAGGRLRR